MTLQPTRLSPTHAARRLDIRKHILDQVRLAQAGRLHGDPTARRFKAQDVPKLSEKESQQQRDALIQGIRADVEAKVAQVRLEAERRNGLARCAAVNNNTSR